MSNVHHIYAIPAAASLCLHVAVLVGLSETFTMPAFDLAKAEKKIELELVDNPPFSEPVFEEPVTDLISDSQQTARDRNIKQGIDSRPTSEGDTEAKELKRSGPESSPDEMVRQLPQQIKQLESMTKELQKEQVKIQEEITENIRAAQEHENQKPAEPTRSASEIAEQKKIFHNIDSEVVELGDPIFATRYDIIVPYLRSMREAIFKAWYPVVSMQAGPMPDSRVVVEFKIKPDGSIIDLEISSLQGSTSFGDICAAAVQKASPFDPIPLEFPPYLKNKFFHIKFTFYYD
jgi:outer membrane biosynthesis protein TonB